MYWWLCAHRAINLPLSQLSLPLPPARLAPTCCKRAKLRLCRARRTLHSTKWHQALAPCLHRPLPPGPAPSPELAPGRAVLGRGPGASCPFPRVFVRPAGRPLPSCTAPVGSDLLAGVAPGAPQSVKYCLLAGFEQNQWSC